MIISTDPVPLGESAWFATPTSGEAHFARNASIRSSARRMFSSELA